MNDPDWNFIRRCLECGEQKTIGPAGEGLRSLSNELNEVWPLTKRKCPVCKELSPAGWVPCGYLPVSEDTYLCP